MGEVGGGRKGLEGKGRVGEGRGKGGSLAAPVAELRQRE